VGWAQRSGAEAFSLLNLTPAPKLNRYAESRADLLVNEKKMLSIDKTAAYQNSLNLMGGSR
jgi:hypothetical protein